MARGEAGTAATICIELVRSLCAGEVDRIELTLPAGATASDALAACGWSPDGGLRVAIWGRLLGRDSLITTLLVDRDRVELLRPLAIDPMEARRRRAQTQRLAGRPGRGARRTKAPPEAG